MDNRDPSSSSTPLLPPPLSSATGQMQGQRQIQSNANVFVRNLYSVLGDSSFAHAIHWSNSGESFVIPDIGVFVTAALPRLGTHSNYASFVRQLNKYQFKKVKGAERSSPSNVCEFKHPFFKLACPHLLNKVSRIKKGRDRAASKPASSGVKKSPTQSPKDEDSDSDSEQLVLPISNVVKKEGRSLESPPFSATTQSPYPAPSPHTVPGVSYSEYMPRPTPADTDQLRKLQRTTSTSSSVSSLCTTTGSTSPQFQAVVMSPVMMHQQTQVAVYSSSHQQQQYQQPFYPQQQFQHMHHQSPHHHHQPPPPPPPNYYHHQPPHYQSPQPDPLIEHVQQLMQSVSNMQQRHDALKQELEGVWTDVSTTKQEVVQVKTAVQERQKSVKEVVEGVLRTLDEDDIEEMDPVERQFWRDVCPDEDFGVDDEVQVAEFVLGERELRQHRARELALRRRRIEHPSRFNFNVSSLPPACNFPHRRVLIVDDCAIYRKILCSYLSHLNFTCETASTGLEAVQKVLRPTSHHEIDDADSTEYPISPPTFHQITPRFHNTSSTLSSSTYLSPPAPPSRSSTPALITSTREPSLPPSPCSSTRTSSPYHLIVMDIMLPSLNGLQATRQIKEAMPHMVVLGMSCVDVTEEDQETYMDVGMSGVVTKPIKFEELVEAVEECVGGVRNYLLDV
ncbi:hypothetical protein BCR33DRAFT_714439 [Rhizoclosmatium globosum]|uniref:Response regulatory domain-containing protein n=1 Tax=Rhizoclosmatium globosum TaxID=329046 RepID=A0A1Y2CNV7_9FUNG|nr:hypothetical protein BCR33DRAFT_714439 [Rhizoclosmatium globosum]|eukprot:ORY48720.1 hypothetical protein BCR33DRAFT_714439 [Rhizoclosmatium globosum]